MPASVNARRRYLKTAPADRYPGLPAAWQRFLRGEALGVFAEIERAALTPGNEAVLYQRMIARLDGFRQFLRVAADREGHGLWDLPWPGAAEALRPCLPAGLNLSAAVQDRLAAWLDRYRALDPERPLGQQAFDWRAFHAEGRDLALAVKDRLGSRVYVEYRPLDEVSHGVQMRLFGL
jgi:hypothetical protein